ncbi:putative carboxypeptidase C [Helianthus annuus]|uniref:Carboxypeptidase C n=1 Tax=Helianthus annuus TaxID=4232 RepID=A0A251UGY9_HELAN|nr:putative carboxypeptidase C [Helianthus annuus]KAJ0572984.1 putative carboxypeptidase C [Helianthus annuus]
MQWNGVVRNSLVQLLMFLLKLMVLKLACSKPMAHSVLVHDVGHMVPMDQPKVALSMLKRWTRRSLSESGAEAESVVSST